MPGPLGQSNALYAHMFLRCPATLKPYQGGFYTANVRSVPCPFRSTENVPFHSANTNGYVRVIHDTYLCWKWKLVRSNQVTYGCHLVMVKHLNHRLHQRGTVNGPAREHNTSHVILQSMKKLT